MQSAMPGSKDMEMTVTLQGPVWIVENAPGAADYNRFYKAAVEKGWIFSDPRAAKGQPGQAKAMAEMYMGGLLAKMGNMSFSTIVDTVETDPLSDYLFAPPAGYKLNPKK